MSIRPFSYYIISLFFLFSFLFVQHTHAATTVTRGAVSIDIQWDIVGGSGTCNGTTNYGNYGDGLKAAWEASHSPSSGSMPVSQVNGNSGAGFPQTYTFWCTDASSGQVDSDTITVNGCPGGTSWDGDSCEVIPVNGICNASHYNCNSGSSGSNSAISNGYTWMCNGSGGGSNDSCYECTGGSIWDGDSCEFTETFAVCGGTAYTCSAGNYPGGGSLSEGGVGSNGSYSWTCNGYPNDVAHRANCNLSCVGAIPTRSISWSPVSVTHPSNSTLSWSTSGAASCRWTRTKPGFGMTVDTGYTTNGGWFPSNPGWNYGTEDPCTAGNPTCNGDTWTVQCKNSCNGYSAEASAALTVGPPDAPPTGTGSVSGGTTGVDCGAVSVSSAIDTDPTPDDTSLEVHVYIDGPAGSGTGYNLGSTSGGSLSGNLTSIGPVPGTGVHSYFIYLLGVDGSGSQNGNNPQIASGNFTCVAPPTPSGNISNDGPVHLPGDNVARITVSSTDAAACEIRDNSNAVVSTITSGTYDTVALTSGTYTYSFRCRDVLNNWTELGSTNVQVVTDALCASGSGSHWSCTRGASANNQTPANPGAGRNWTWDCNSTDGGFNDLACSESGFWLTTSITSGGAGGSITPGTTLYSSGSAANTTINVPTYVIPPTGASWAIQSKTVDSVTTSVNGTTPVDPNNNFTMNADHSVSAVLYQPDPITTIITQHPTVYLGDSATIRWTTDGNRCNLYNFDGSVLIKAIGAVSVAPTENQVVLTAGELPQTVDAFGYIMRCDDSGDINRGQVDTPVTITLTCPRDPESYNQVTQTTCNNPVPVVGIAPGNQTIVLGQSAVYTSVATDGTNDIVAHEMEWQKPNGTWSWQPPANGSVSYAMGDETLFPGTPKGSNTLTATFTPTQDGVYFVRFVAMDDTLNNPALSYIVNPNPRYYTSGGRLTYSGNYRLTVTTRVGANIQPDTGGRLRWTCFNADYGSVVRSTDNFASTINPPVLSYRSLPPSTGTFMPSPGEAYRLLCETSIDSATFTYYQPTLTENSVTSTTADIAYNCNSGSAQSATLQRISGMAPTSYSAVANPSYIDSGLTPQTNYTYVLRCYDGPLVLSAVSGNQIGYASLNIQTTNAIIDLNPVVISSYIRGKGADPVGMSSATTTDGGFFEWNYTITSGTPTSCTMQQRNDGGAWYPQPGYDTSVLGYTMGWGGLLAADKQSFVNGYQNTHDWRISCVNPLGTITTKTWTLTKVQPSIAIIDSITEGAPPVIADVVFRCVPASVRYNIKDPNDVDVPGHTNQLYSGPVTFSPRTTDPTPYGNYKITCDNGPVTVLLISATMWDPFVRLSGTQRTAGGVTSATLTWDISNPDATCRIWADVTIPTGCDASCLANRTAASSTINTILQTGYTDGNDPYWPNGMASRTITRALTEEAYNTPNARGRVTINNIRYGTTFTAQCNGSAPAKVRVGVTTTNEG